MTRGRRLMVWGAVSAVLLAVFAAYLRPDLAVTLANQIWNCF
ncbi:MAG: hypothetical protein ABW190_14380 [Rhizobacter sp.]